MHVVFVAPYFLPATVRFIDAVTSLPGTRVGLISQDPVEMLPAGLRSRLGDHERVSQGLNPNQLLLAARELRRRMGRVDRLFGSLEDLQVALAQVRDAMGIEGMSARAANRFRDKSVMKTVMRQAGLPCARHLLATSSEEAHAFGRQIGFPIVLKPPAGAGARNTFQVDTTEDLRIAISGYPPSHQKPVMMEEFIRGQEYSFDAISIRGETVWHSITRYHPNPLDVLRNPWIQWCILLPREIDGPQYEGIRQIGPQALKALGMTTGMCHMEWFRRTDGSIAISEVAARPPGAQITTLHGYAHDIDLFKAWARLMVFHQFDLPRRKYAAGVAFLRGMGQGRVKAIRGLEQAHRDLGPLVVEAKLPTKGQPAVSGYEGQGYVIVRHKETTVVETALKRLINTIRVELE